MSTTLERWIAWRYLKAPRKEGFVSVIAGFSFLGIALGVAALIIVMSVMNGFRYELRDRLVGFNGHLTVVASGDSTVSQEAMMAIPSVRSAGPLIDKHGICLAGRASSGCWIRGVRAEDLQRRPLIADHLVQGSLSAFVGETVVVGHKLAMALGVKVGDTVRILRPEGKATAFGAMPYSRHFRVVALFDSGMHEYDKVCLFMPIQAAQDFFEQPFVGVYEVFVQDWDGLPGVKDRLMRMDPSLQIHDWQQSNSNFFKAIQVQRHVMFLILALIVLVAAFNIISGLVMLVKDKTKDIAILRTMGATRGMILRLFFMTGAWIGLSSTAVGTAVGLLVALNVDRIRTVLESFSGKSLFQAEIYFLSSLPCRVQMADVVSVVAMALVLSFLATLYPAWKAARLNPVQGLRYE